MDTPPKHRGKSFLTRSVKSIKRANPDLSDLENRALGRLGADNRAVTAFNYLPNQSAADALVWTYIEALEVKRSFDSEIAWSQHLLGNKRQQGELDRLVNGLVAVGRFFENLQKQPLGWVASQQRVAPGELRQLFVAFETAKDLLEQQRRIANETPKRLGATRNTGPGAAERAVIGWLATGVRFQTRKPNREIVRLLAEVVLERSVTGLQVLKVEKSRLGREWRLPFRTQGRGQNPYVGQITSSRRTDFRRRTASEARQGRLVERPVQRPFHLDLRYLTNLLEAKISAEQVTPSDAS
jgi:hypothetical protein